MAGSDKAQAVSYFPEDMLKEIQDEATRQDRSLSWIVQKAWKIARKEIMKYPSVNEFPGEEDEKEIAVSWRRDAGGGVRRRPSDGSPLFYESLGERGGQDAGPVVRRHRLRRLRLALPARRPADRFGAASSLSRPRPNGGAARSARVTIEDLADDVACVLDDALVDRAVLIGHSMGVQVALETYRRHRARVAGLVLVCGAPSHPLETFRGSAALEELLPTIQKWIHRVPGVINRVTADAAADAAGLRGREPARDPPRAGRAGGLHALPRRAWRGSTRGCSSRCCRPPASTPPTICSRDHGADPGRRRRARWLHAARAQPRDGRGDPGSGAARDPQTPLTPRRSSGPIWSTGRFAISWRRRIDRRLDATSRE